MKQEVAFSNLHNWRNSFLNWLISEIRFDHFLETRFQTRVVELLNRLTTNRIWILHLNIFYIIK